MITRLNSRVLSLLATVLVISAAHATQPVIEPAPFDDFTDTTCGFPLQIHFTANGQTAKFFSDGMIIFTGPLKATYSANGKSLSLNIPGPSMLKQSGAVIGAGVGAAPILLPDGELTFGYGAGQFDISSGTTAELLHGHLVLDICDALAP